MSDFKIKGTFYNERARLAERANPADFAELDAETEDAVRAVLAQCNTPDDALRLAEFVDSLEESDMNGFEQRRALMEFAGEFH